MKRGSEKGIEESLTMDILGLTREAPGEGGDESIGFCRLA